MDWKEFDTPEGFWQKMVEVANLPECRNDRRHEATRWAAEVIERAGNVEGLRVKIKHDSWPITLHNDPFILYQEGNMSKGKLCEYIARAVRDYVLGEG